jgi:adenylate cyclase, class 2
MDTEIELKFVNVNHDDIRQKLTKLGATLLSPMRLMRRVIIETPDLISKNGYIRIRDEGDKTTVTYKQFNELSVDGAKEIEITVSDFQKTIDLFKAAGLDYKSFQESKRETWKLVDTEVVLDVWPWLNEYIEIEGTSESELRNSASKLGLKWENAVFGDVMAAYRIQYPHISDKDTVANLASVRFGDPLPDFLI